MLSCPICANTTFDTYGGRVGARCMGCGSLERGRLAWLVLTKLDQLRPGVRLLNNAPEPFMLSFGAKRLCAGYTPADYDPSLFAKWNRKILQFDMCNPQGFAPGSFDCIMHNHVLEHLPCDVVGALRGLNALVAPGGYHLFSAPIMPHRTTIEDFRPDLTPQERLRRFGQDDHVRMFGALDFMTFIERAGMMEGMIDLSPLISAAELEAAGLNPQVFETCNPHRIFAWRRAKEE